MPVNLSKGEILEKDSLVEKVSHRCPICEAENSFVPFNGRPLARCSKCLCVERNRLMWLAINQLALPKKTSRVLHFAPEYGIASRISAICGENYVACDLSPERYKSRFFTVKRFDLCTDLWSTPDAAFDLILHNHVLEHLSCSMEMVFRQLDRVLSPGGAHLFSVPLRGDYTQEDISPDLSPEERRKRFGQEDHLRIFGVRDLTALLRQIWGQEQVLFDFRDVFDEGYLTQSGISPDILTMTTSHSMFLRHKPRE